MRKIRAISRIPPSIDRSIMVSISIHAALGGVAMSGCSHAGTLPRSPSAPVISEIPVDVVLHTEPFLPSGPSKGLSAGGAKDASLRSGSSASHAGKGAVNPTSEMKGKGAPLEPAITSSKGFSGGDDEPVLGDAAEKGNGSKGPGAGYSGGDASGDERGGGNRAQVGPKEPDSKRFYDDALWELRKRKGQSGTCRAELAEGTFVVDLGTGHIQSSAGSLPISYTRVFNACN